MRSRSLSLSVWRAEFILGVQIGGPDRADDLPRIRIDGIWMRAEMDALLAVAAAVPPPLAADIGIEVATETAAWARSCGQIC